MRVISYNVLEGMKEPPGRREAIAAWLAAQTPDVVAFQELNGYTEARLREEAQAWGHAHAALLKDKGYATGLTSRAPIAGVQRVLGGFHHGALRLRTGGVTYYVVHFSPFETGVRVKEAGQILAGMKDDGKGQALDGAQAALDAKQPVVVLGDFNSASPDDRVTPGKGCADELHFQVLRNFKDAGFTDTVRAKHDDPKALRSCPTPLAHPELSREGLKKIQMRIDYILVSPELAQACTRAEAMNSEAFDTMSDHYPLVADFDWAPEGH